MRRARLTKSEGPYRQGETVTDSPNQAGATYVDPGRFDTWFTAGLLEPVDDLDEMTSAEIEKIAEAAGVDVQELEGSGKGGRVVKRDLVAAVRGARGVSDG